MRTRTKIIVFLPIIIAACGQPEDSGSKPSWKSATTESTNAARKNATEPSTPTAPDTNGTGDKNVQAAPVQTMKSVYDGFTEDMKREIVKEIACQNNSGLRVDLPIHMVALANRIRNNGGKAAACKMRPANAPLRNGKPSQ